MEIQLGCSSARLRPRLCSRGKGPGVRGRVHWNSEYLGLVGWERGSFDSGVSRYIKMVYEQGCSSLSVSAFPILKSLSTQADILESSSLS